MSCRTFHYIIPRRTHTYTNSDEKQKNAEKM